MKFDTSLSPAILFYSTLETVDTQHRLVATQLKEAALLATVGYLRGSRRDGQEAMRKIIERLTNDAATGVLTHIKAIDLINSAAACEPAEIEAGLSSVGISLSILLDGISNAEEFATDPAVGVVDFSDRDET